MKRNNSHIHSPTTGKEAAAVTPQSCAPSLSQPSCWWWELYPEATAHMAVQRPPPPQHGPLPPPSELTALLSCTFCCTCGLPGPACPLLGHCCGPTASAEDRSLGSQVENTAAQCSPSLRGSGTGQYTLQQLALLEKVVCVFSLIL